MSNRINQEIADAIQEIKKTISEGKDLETQDLEILFLASLFEEES